MAAQNTYQRKRLWSSSHQKYWNTSKQTFHVASKHLSKMILNNEMRERKSLFPFLFSRKKRPEENVIFHCILHYWFLFQAFAFFSLSFKKERQMSGKEYNIINSMWKIVRLAFLQNVFEEHFQRKCSGIIFFWPVVTTDVEALNSLFKNWKN